jgi:hypothetical protein
MSISIVAILGIAFLIMLGVLGHGQWHGGETAFMGFIVNIFTGAKVVG